MKTLHRYMFPVCRITLHQFFILQIWSSKALALKMEERREKEILSANYKTDFNTYYAPVTTSYQPENYNRNGQLSVHHLQTTTQVR